MYSDWGEDGHNKLDEKLDRQVGEGEKRQREKLNKTYPFALYK